MDGWVGGRAGGRADGRARSGVSPITGALCVCCASQGPGSQIDHLTPASQLRFRRKQTLDRAVLCCFFAVLRCCLPAQVTAPALDMQFLDTEMMPLMENAFSGGCWSAEPSACPLALLSAHGPFSYQRGCIFSP